MRTDPPSEAERAALLAQHAHRHPMPARIPVTGDRGERISLSVLVGNPSGACRPAPGVRPAPVWADMIAALYVRGKHAPSQDDLVADCLLWPDLHTLNAWRERWPAIARDVARAAIQKYGGNCMDAVAPEALAPKPITDALAADLRAVYRVLRPPRAVYHVAIAPPSLESYNLFADSTAKADADHWALLREFAALQTSAIDGAESIALAIERFPGIAISIAQASLDLAGAAEDARMGEW